MKRQDGVCACWNSDTQREGVGSATAKQRRIAATLSLWQHVMATPRGARHSKTLHCGCAACLCEGVGAHATGSHTDAAPLAERHEFFGGILRELAHVPACVCA